MREWFPVTLVAAFCLITSPVHAYKTKELIENQLDPRVDWESLEVPGFILHYPADAREQALELAATAERVHLRLTETLGIVPDGPTHVVLAHRSDQPRVFTIVSPHRQIFLDLAVPDLSIGINEFGSRFDWLLTHEYTHVLHLDAKRGVYRGLSWLIGSNAHANEMLPPWLKEGVAVAAETKYTRRGRADSPRYSMMIRAAYMDGLLDDPEFASPGTAGSFEVETWPWTLRPYLFGTYLVRTLLDRGLTLQDIMLATADGLPGHLQLALDRAGFATQQALWDATITQLKREAQAELDVLRERPATELEYLTDTGFYYFGLAMAPNGKWLVATHETPTRDKTLLRFNLDGDAVSAPEALFERTTGYRSSFSRSSRFIAFDQSQYISRYYLMSDVFLYDLKEQALISASPGFHAREPAIHPDGKHIAFVINENAKTRLVMTDTAWQNGVDLLGDVGYRRISSPAFSPDGAVLAITVHNEENGGEELWLVDPDGQPYRLIADGSEAGEPSFTEDGRYLLFSCDTTGVFNVYAWDLETHELFQVSHVLGGVMSPVASIDSRWVYVASYRGRGYDLARFHFAPESWSSLGVVDPTPIDKDTLHAPAATVTATPEPYSGLSHLAPQYVAPSILLRPHSFQFGAKVGAVDPLFFHHYELALRFDTVTKEPVGRAYYFNGTTILPIEVELTRDAVPVQSENSYLRLFNGVVGVNIPLNTNSHALRLRPGIVGMDVNFRGHTLYGGGELGLIHDTEFRQIGQTFPEQGSYFSATVRELSFAPWDTALTAVLAKVRLHFAGFAARQALHLSFQAGAYVAGTHGNAAFYTGGAVSFPFELDSEFLLYGYPVNTFVTQRAALGTARYTLRAVNFDAGFQAVPLFLGRLSLAAVAQLAGFENARDVHDLPWSLGVELHQDVTVSYIFDFALQLGLYRGEPTLGGGTQLILTVGAR